MTTSLDEAAVFAVVVETLRKICRSRLDGLSADDSIETVPGLDSLRLIDATVRLEKELGVEVDTDRLGDLRTVGDLVEMFLAARPLD